MDATDAILASVIRSSLDCIVVIDDAGAVVEFNPAAEAVFGYSREQALGRPIGGLIVPPHLRTAHTHGFARYLAGGAPRVLGQRIEVEAMRADGTLFPVELAITEAAVGDRRLFTACLRDLSERRAAEAALRASEARLAAFLEHAPAAMYLKDLEGRYVVVNRYMSEILGRPLNELVGHEIGEVLGDAAAERVRATDRVLLESGAPEVSEVEFPTITGPRTTMAVRFPIRDAVGRITHLGGVIVDVSQQKRVEEELRQSEGRFRALSESHPTPVTFMRTSDGQIVMANPAFREMMRLPPDQTDVNAFARFPSEAERDRLLHLRRTVDHADNVEAQLRRFDGTVFSAAMSWRWIELDGEQIVVSSFVDLTDRKAAEAELERSRDQLHQSEKLSALGSLLAGVSHELNNPLAVVVGESIILEEDAENTPLAESAGRIKRAAERCSRIVQTFLAMARQKKPERTRVEANALVTAALDLADYGLRTAGVRVQTELSEGLKPILGDADQLHQVVVNLLINAQQALQEMTGPRQVTVRTLAAGPGAVAIEVVDNGPGVPADAARRIFEPFYTTKPQGLGTGLGLSFSLGVAEAHGGRLRLVDGASGATFRLELPVDGAGARPSAGVIASEPPARGRALVVDDEADLADTLARFLTRDGYSVEVAIGGTEAVEKLRGQDYDVILSDLRMPDLDGPALHAWLLAERPHLVDRIAFVTGDTLGPAATRFLSRAERPYIEKPFTREAVRRLLNALAPPAG